MKLRLAIIVLSVLLAFGCISMGNEALNESGEGNTTPPEQNVTPPVINDTNQTDQTNQTNQTEQPPLPPKEWVRYNASGVSFEYPINMTTNIISGKFLGVTTSGNLTIERMAVSYVNTLQAYGKNKDDIFKDNPTKTAADFLVQDKENDSLDMLDDAYSVGEVSTFTISRGVYAAEVPFKLRIGDSSAYNGYALSIYVPDLSLHIKARILAIDPDRAEAIRDNFILSFWLE